MEEEQRTWLQQWDREDHLIYEVVRRFWDARIKEWCRRNLKCWGSPFVQTSQSPLTHQFSSVQFSHSVVSDSLQPHESQHARPPCPSPIPGVYSNSCPLSRERVTGRKARGLQMEEVACKCQTFLSLLSGRRKQTSNIFSFSIQI